MTSPAVTAVTTYEQQKHLFSLTDNEASITRGKISPNMSGQSRRSLTRGSSIYSDAGSDVEDATTAGDTTNVANPPDYRRDSRHHGAARVAHLGDALPRSAGRPDTASIFHSSDGHDDDFSGDTQVKPHHNEVARDELETRNFDRGGVTSSMCSPCCSRALM